MKIKTQVMATVAGKTAVEMLQQVADYYKMTGKYDYYYKILEAIEKIEAVVI